MRVGHKGNSERNETVSVTFSVPGISPFLTSPAPRFDFASKVYCICMIVELEAAAGALYFGTGALPLEIPHGVGLLFSNFDWKSFPTHWLIMQSFVSIRQKGNIICTQDENAPLALLMHIFDFRSIFQRKRQEGSVH